MVDQLAQGAAIGNPVLRRPENKRYENLPGWMIGLIRNDPDINAELIEVAGEDAW